MCDRLPDDAGQQQLPASAVHAMAYRSARQPWNVSCSFVFLLGAMLCCALIRSIVKTSCSMQGMHDEVVLPLLSFQQPKPNLSGAQTFA